MDFLTAKQIADIWGVTPRRVQDMCRKGIIPGAARHGREWLIPADVKREKTKNFVQTKSPELPDKSSDFADRKRVYGPILDLYKSPGSAESLINSLAYDEFSRDICESQFAFHQGDFTKAIELAFRHYDEHETGVDHRVAVGWQMVLSSVYTGNIKLWQTGTAYMSGAVCKSDDEKLLLQFWIGTTACAIGDYSYFPEWFRRGDFTKLPAKSYAVAAYHYVKYLFTALTYTESQKEGRKTALESMQAMPFIIEPIISAVHARRVVIIEIYLRLSCALAYHIIGKDEFAIPHIDEAIALSAPDKIYAPLSEYRRHFGFLIDDRISINNADMLHSIKRISKSLLDGGTALHNAFLGKSRTSLLSTREWQAAKLTVYGLSNKEIADRMGISLNAVKQTLRLAMDKTGAERRSDLRNFV